MADGERTKEKVEQEQGEESTKDRLEREHGELLEELRALIPGAEVLFGFLLAIRFTGQFKDLTTAQESLYYVALVSTAVALVLFLAPAAHHRIRFREGDKEYMLKKGNREAIAGTVAMALAFTGALYVVSDLVLGTVAAVLVALGFFALTAWRWWALALLREFQGR